MKNCGFFLKKMFNVLHKISLKTNLPSLPPSLLSFFPSFLFFYCSNSSTHHCIFTATFVSQQNLGPDEIGIV